MSSIASLGIAEDDELIDEETKWKNSANSSNYTISKYGAEREVWRGTIEGLPAVIVNPSVIIGPGDWNKGSSQLFQQVWNGLKFYTNGINGYVDVRDVSKAMILLMDSDIINSRYIISSENIDYLQLFTMISEGIYKKAPTIKVNLFLSQLAWIAEKMRSIMTGKKSLITRETARKAFNKYSYSNEKIKKALNLEFIPMPQSIGETSKLFLKEISPR